MNPEAKFNNFNLDYLLDELLLNIRHLINCDAGSIYLKEKDNLIFHIFQNDSIEKKLLKSLSSFATVAIVKLQNNIFGMHLINKNLIDMNNRLNKRIIESDCKDKINSNLSHELEIIESAVKSIKMQNEICIDDKKLFEMTINLIESNIKNIKKKI